MVCCRRPHVLLGVSGSVAAIKVPLIAKLLADFCDVVVIATDASRKLLAVDQLEAMHLPVKGASPLLYEFGFARRPCILCMCSNSCRPCISCQRCSRRPV